MTDMAVGVRLTGDGKQLEGQLNAVTAAEKRLADATAALAQKQAEVTAATKTAQSALKAGEISQEQYNTAVLQGKVALDALQREFRESVAGLGQLDAAQKKVTASAGQMRTAGSQLGFQIQDITQSVALGISPMTIFAQQAGQTAFALSNFGGAAGAVGRALTGVWGAAILGGITLLGAFGTALFNTSDAMKEVELAANNLGNVQSTLGDMFDLTTGKIKNQNEALRLNASLMAINLRAEAAAKEASSRGVFNAASTGRKSTLDDILATVTFRSSSVGRDRVNVASQLQSLVRQRREGTLDASSAARIAETLNFSGQQFSREEFLQALADEATAKSNRDLADKIDSSLSSGSLDPALRKDASSKSTKSKTDTASKEAERLAAFGAKAAEQILRISEAFDSQPKLVDRVNQGVRDLDKIISDLNKKQPKGFKDMIAEAEKAKLVVQSALGQPFRDYVEDTERARQIQELTLAGREEEAAALRVIYQLQDRVGFVTEEQRKTILENVKAEKLLNEQLAQRAQLVAAYTDSISSVRNDLEGLLGGRLGGGDFLKNLRSSYQQLQGKVLTEQIFGPTLRGLEEYVKEKTGIESAVDIMKVGTTDAGNAAKTMATVLEEASKRVAGTFGGETGTVAATGGVLSEDFKSAVFGAAGPSDAAPESETITVLANVDDNTAKVARGVMGLTPQQFARLQAEAIVKPFGDLLTPLLGERFAKTLTGPLTGAVEGYLTAGPVGAGLGVLKDLPGLPDKLSAKLGDAFKGAQTGTQVAAIGKALGLGGSTTGAQIGGALGAATGIPGADIVGSILGSVIGGALKSTKRGSATIGLVDGELGVSGTRGNSQSRIQASTAAADSIIGGLYQIAEALGGEVSGPANVSIGVRKKNFRVDTSGAGITKTSKGAVDFGQDEAAAIAFAISDAIADGAIAGLSPAIQKAIQSNSDLDKALNEALKVKQLEDALGGFAGAADAAFRAFEKQAKDRLRIATEYGLEVVKVEELNAKDRLDLRSQLEEQSFGSLKDLLDRLKFGDLSEGSAIDRRNAILAQIDTTKAAAIAGEAGASDKLAQLLEDLNTISRDVFGTGGAYAGDRSLIEETAGSVISLLNSQLDDAAAAAQEQTNTLLDENNDQNSQVINQLTQMNATLAGLGFGDFGLSADDLAALAAAAYTGGGAQAAPSSNRLYLPG